MGLVAGMAVAHVDFAIHLNPALAAKGAGVGICLGRSAAGAACQQRHAG